MGKKDRGIRTRGGRIILIKWLRQRHRVHTAPLKGVREPCRLGGGRTEDVFKPECQSAEALRQKHARGVRGPARRQWCGSSESGTVKVTVREAREAG